MFTKTLLATAAAALISAGVMAVSTGSAEAHYAYQAGYYVTKEIVVPKTIYKTFYKTVLTGYDNCYKPIYGQVAYSDYETVYVTEYEKVFVPYSYDNGSNDAPVVQLRAVIRLPILSRSNGFGPPSACSSRVCPRAGRTPSPGMAARKTKSKFKKILQAGCGCSAKPLNAHFAGGSATVYPAVPTDFPVERLTERGGVVPSSDTRMISGQGNCDG